MSNLDECVKCFGKTSALTVLELRVVPSKKHLSVLPVHRDYEIWKYVMKSLGVGHERSSIFHD